MMGAWDTLPWGRCKFYNQILSICLCSNYTTSFDQQRHVCIRNSCTDCFLTNFPSMSLARAHMLTHTITVIIRDLISQVVVSAESCHAHCGIHPSCWFVGVLVPSLEDSFLFLKSAHAWEKLCARCQDTVPLTSCHFLDLICKPHWFHLPDCF